MMNKKHLLLGLGSMITLAPVSAMVVSCGKEEKNNELNENSIVSDWQFTLNSKGQQISADQFVVQCNETDILTVFKEYTNINQLENDLLSQNVTFVIKRPTVSSTGNSVNFEIVFSDKKRELNVPYILSGFLTNNQYANSVLDLIIDDFKQNVIPNLRANSNQTLTSQDIWNEWYQALPYNKNVILFNNILGFPNSLVQSNVYNGASVKLANNFSTEEQAKEWVNWNSDEPNEQIKGTKLSIKMNFSISRTLESNETIVVSKDVNFEVVGWTSYQEAFNSLCNNFVSRNGGIRIKDSSVTAYNVFVEYNNAGDESQKLSALKKYLDFTQLDIDLGSQILEVKENKDNPLSLIIVSKLTWRGMEKNVELNIGPFQSDDSYFNTLKENLKNLKLFPTKEGQTISSQEVANEWKSDPQTLQKYVSGIPTSDEVVTYRIANVDWDQEANITSQGSTLYINIELIYNKISATISLNPVTGFFPPYVKYQNEFLNKVNQIQLSLKPTSNNLINLDVNSNNWSEHILGIPEQNDNYKIINLNFNYDGGTNGKLNISFTYSWKSPINYTFTDEISQDISGFVKYSERSNQNFSQVLLQMNKTNFLDSIQVQGTKKSDWLTSYFGNDLGRDYNSQQLINGIKRLWNIPNDYFGVTFKITNIKYSKTDSSLSNTQLKIAFELKDNYNSSNSFSKEYIVDGFLDPYTSQANDLKTWGDGWELNNKNISKYSQVESILQCGQANTQINILNGGYWRLEPYKFYAEGQNNGGYQQKWVQYASGKILGVLNQWYGDNKISISVYSTSYVWLGEVRHGNKDSGGTCVTPIKTQIKFTTKAIDAKGNSAEGKYPEILTKGLVLWLYWSNQWWGG